MSGWVKYFEDRERTIFNRCIACRRLLEIIISNTPRNGRILQVGCGTAILSLILADCGFQVTASDIDPRVLDYAQEKIGLKYPNLKFQQIDMFKLGDAFENNYFDTVFSKSLMEHCEDKDIIKGLAEQKKIARKVIFYVPNRKGKISFGNERLLSNRYWIKLIKEAGFQEIKLFGDYDIQRYIYFFPILIYHRKFSFVWRFLSNHSIFVCK